MSRQALLVLNAGSSSLKFATFVADTLLPLVHGQVEGLGESPHVVIKNQAGGVQLAQHWDSAQAHDADGDHERALRLLMQTLPQQLQGHTLRAVGHRVVHGGREFLEPVVLDEATVAKLRTLCPLAPLHQPHNLAPIEALHRRWPDLPQVACFDTAFHAHNPDVAQRLALPRALHDAGVRRYGFHGLSYEYIASRLPDVDPRAAQGRTVVLHLGNGASACAMRGGVSVATSMGFTALDGLMMGSRCGSLDPGVVLWLMDNQHLDARQIEHLLYSESGLLGVSGLSSDMRTLLDSSDPHAEQAIALYVHRVGCEIGALTAALGGIDALVFTAGIGEHAVAVRERIARHAAWLGMALDEQTNAAPLRQGEQARCISAPKSPVTAWVLPTNEERVVAQHTARLTALA